MSASLREGPFNHQDQLKMGVGGRHLPKTHEKRVVVIRQSRGLGSSFQAEKQGQETGDQLYIKQRSIYLVLKYFEGVRHDDAHLNFSTLGGRGNRISGNLRLTSSTQSSS